MRLDPHFGMLPIGAFKHCGDRRIRLYGGGGGIPVVDDVLDFGGDIVDSAVDIVDSAASAVGDVLDKAVTAVDNTIQAALDDPVKAAAIAAAIAMGQPELIPYIQGTAALAHGATPEEALQQAAIAYAAGEVGSGVASETGSNIAGGSAAGASNAALRGGDVEQGLISGGINAGIGNAAKSISDQNFEDWAKEQAGNTYDNAPSPTEQDVLDAMDREANGSPLSGVGDSSDASSLPPESYDPALTTSQIKSGLTFVKNALLNPAGSSIAGLGSAGATGLGGSNSSPQQTTAPLTAIDFTPKFLDTNPRFLETKVVSGSQPRMQELKQLYGPADRDSGDSTQNMADGGLAESLNPTEKNLGFVKPYSSNVLPAAPLMQNQIKINPLRHLHESLINRQRTAGGLAAGGLPKKYAEALPEGHKPEFITGLTGYYASGKGTGQSDDIDAMLHDGDYVADADLVAALGDGSSKAGAEALEKFRRQVPHNDRAAGGSAVPAKIADGEYVFPASFVTAIGQGDNKTGAKILDKMREAIRAHKRSAPTTKIPPKAKSPLEYLKMVKG